MPYCLQPSNPCPNTHLEGKPPQRSTPFLPIFHPRAPEHFSLVIKPQESCVEVLVHTPQSIHGAAGRVFS